MKSNQNSMAANKTTVGAKGKAPVTNSTADTSDKSDKGTSASTKTSY